VLNYREQNAWTLSEVTDGVVCAVLLPSACLTTYPALSMRCGARASSVRGWASERGEAGRPTAATAQVPWTVAED
jgi:hypothetical protein